VKLIFDKSVPGRRTYAPPTVDFDASAVIPQEMMRETPAALPELSEVDVVRHFTELSRRNFGVDTGFYPLGSCTMKYNPKFCEDLSRLPGFAGLHPMLALVPGGADAAQGALCVVWEMQRLLAEICGMAAFSTQPLAGAHGELTGVLLMAAYHRDRGNRKTTILVPDSAHGTNPASAACGGYTIRNVPSDDTGVMDVDALAEALADDVAGLMLTCPNTLGLFHPRVAEICRMVHAVDGLVYCDGANLNALLGRCRPGDIGFDVMHVNLHKTFATPHGGGGPGAGPVGVCGKLVDFLPTPFVERSPDGRFSVSTDRPKSIGPVAPFFGNFGVMVKAYAYILRLGREGLCRVSENAVLSANYVKEKLRPYFDIPHGQLCKHECVFSASRQVENGVHALDIAKALIDRGFHPPTVYFPLVVPEAMMIEPTETESVETLDAFVEAMVEIAGLAEGDADSLHEAPVTTPVGRLDETRAARDPDLASLA